MSVEKDQFLYKIWDKFKKNRWDKQVKFYDILYNTWSLVLSGVVKSSPQNIVFYTWKVQFLTIDEHKSWIQKLNFIIFWHWKVAIYFPFSYTLWKIWKINTWDIVVLNFYPTRFFKFADIYLSGYKIDNIKFFVNKNLYNLHPLFRDKIVEIQFFKNNFKWNWLNWNINFFKVIWKKCLTWKDLSQFGLKTWWKDEIFGIKIWKCVSKLNINYKLENLTWKEQIQFKIPEKWEYFIAFKDKRNYPYILKFEVHDKVTYFRDIDSDNLTLCINTDFPIKYSKTFSNFKSFFRPYEITKFDVVDCDFAIRYYIPPNKLFSGYVDVPTIVWDIRVPISVKISKIPNKFKYASIYADRVNVLPAKGYWWSKIRIWFKNITWFDLYFQKCKLNLKPNLTWRWSMKIDEYFFDCGSGKVIHKFYSVKDFKYWKEYQIDYDLPKQVKSWNYFRVSFYKDFRASKFFKRTNIWDFVKVSVGDWKFNYLVFLNYFDSWSPVTGWSLTVYRLDKNFKLKKIKEIAIKNWQVKFMLSWDGYDNRPLVLYYKIWDDETFSVISKDWYPRWYLKDAYKDFNYISYINWYDIWQKSYWFWNSLKNIKIYWYTDRGLYKPWDDIFFAWWVKDVINPNKTMTWYVIVKLKLRGEDIEKIKIEKLDEYWGFKWKFTLSKSAQLWTYQVEYIYTDKIRYSHDIKVEEYQKPTFFIDAKLLNQNNNIFLKIKPQYYFWQILKDYDLKVSRYVEAKDYCRRCRWRNEKDFYYNWVFQNSFSTWWDYKYNSVSGDAVLKIIDFNIFKNLWYKFKFRADIKIKDNATDETHFETVYLNIDPIVFVGLSWQPVERFYKSDLKDGIVKISWNIKDYNKVKNLIDKTKFIVYKRNFWYSEEKWVDGNYYYVNNYKFVVYNSGYIAVNKQGNFNIWFKVNGPWEYFVRVIVYDKNSKVLGEVQKRIYWYDFEGYDRWYMWDQKNNFVLNVQVPKKEYKLWENIEININPYIKWSYIVLTVERWDNILDVYRFKLNWQKITIPVKKNYYPNVNISVIQLVWENLSKQNIFKTVRPSEPRFYVWYANADISQDLVKLNIKIDFTKKVYKPWEKFEFTIYTTDAQGNPVDARLSVAIVDKALVDLYDLIKKPIPYFYNKVWSFVNNFSSWKLLYQALRVFTAEGTKWWWGGVFNLISLRKKFYDLAFWRWWVYTKNWKITLETTLPDNTTTWMIDVIWITKDLKLWTQRAYFKVAKPLMVQVNLPTFVTVWDELRIPVSVEWSDLNWQKIDLKFEIGFDSWEVINWQKVWDVKTSAGKVNYFDITLPYDKFDSEKVRFKAIATNWKYSDWVKLWIPLRKKGFRLSKFYFTWWKYGNYNFTFETWVVKAVYEFAVSKLPIQAFFKAFNRLLHYPYWCTEQITSGLYPILVASYLNENKIPLGDIVKDWKVKIKYKGYVDIKQVVEETIEKIFRNQKSSWGLGYWPNEEENANPILSAYVYWALKLAQKQWFNVPVEKLNKLENYLNNLWNQRDVFLYYLWVRTVLGEPINKPLFESLISKWNLNLAEKVLAFAIYSNLWDDPKALKYKKQIDFSSDYKLSDRYWTFLDKDILKAIYLRWLLNFKDKKFDKEVNDLVLYFLSSRNSDWVWWRSTQKNVQILLALWDYLSKKFKVANVIKCKVNINDVVKQIQFENTYKFNINFQDINTIKVKWDCSDDILIDQKVNYVLKDLNYIKNQLHNLTGVSWTYTWGENIWDVGIWRWTFKTLTEANQLAVEFYIPSTYKFLNTISKKKNNWCDGRWCRDLPIEINWSCRRHLKHYEIRFDRLFLYFDRLNIWEGNCIVKIKTIKAFNWKANLMPVHIWEMYKTKVWGIWRR